ncbi:aminodeoxychorismate lyase [Corynebacterium sp. zg-331]|uniref:aminodeoxychorismate lyase n=1 Tax=unclassified Corynebacterium TaxID=2624378 RepID=UPI00128B9A62|nr:MULTISPECIES: aminodeoxychorismate lyase [unclassified Corynebacterium]MBC3186951.1 aminodeoxychorismate lyase [Corynebacterium sp. zg-331]MPV53429.1 aminodeoxychorismate lyase [Corynebacterium sp. zg331]
MPGTTAPIIFILEPFGGSLRRHNPSLPFLFWDDAAVTRGDGVFETFLVRRGRVCNEQRHARRFAASARALGLPAPDLDYWRGATREALAAWVAEHGEDAEGTCVWTYSHGRAATGHPSAWLIIAPLSPEQRRQREEGVRVLTLPRGLGVNEQAAEWMAAGAKTLNYAAAMSALRYARAQGCDDVIYTEGTGDQARVLEGVTSTVVVVKKSGRMRTPTPGLGVLAGTTQAALFDAAEAAGWRCKTKDLTVADLAAAQSVWLVSSVRLAARVRSLNGKELPAPANEEEIRALIERAVAG